MHRPPPSGTPLQRLLVVGVGYTRYVVYDGCSTAGEYWLYDIYDDQFSYLTSLAG
jgi:hypothetical protein